MRTFMCSCGNRLFFDNSICMKCKHEVGWCPICAAIRDVVTTDDGGFACTTCHTNLIKCSNYASYNVCNRFVACDQSKGTQGAASAGTLCSACKYNRTIPDLSVPGNREKWYKLEAAKRRTFYDLDLLGFPYGNQSDGIKPALAFEFKADIVPNQVYRGVTGGQKVFTGHDNGVITINIQEADDAAREKLRVDMGEFHRSLLGHFRHEFGHYVWDVMIKGSLEADCIAVFGDHNNPPYDAALQAYYKNGPAANWLTNYISAYATMHPWEDFAETFAEYLDMVAGLGTAWSGKLLPKEPDLTKFDEMVDTYCELGVSLNEMNRSNGLLDYLPEVIAGKVRDKMRYIHQLARPKTAQQPTTLKAGDACEPTTTAPAPVPAGAAS